MEMGYEDVRVVDTGLVLGLGCGDRSCSASGHTAAKPQNDYFKISSSLHGSGSSAEPSLTLGRQFLAENMVISKKSAGEEQRNGHPSSPQSMASSLSNNFPCTNVKRERVDVAVEDVDAERAMSSRVSDEDDEASAKKKLRLTKEQSALLEERFKEHSTLNPKQKVALAKQLNLRPRQVEVWFQNRRARTKLKQTEVDCEFLKRCCESLTDENRRLQKELQQLRALKLATPLYMQIPAAATLTMCPSCERINGSSSSSDDSKEASTIVVAPKPHFYNSFTRSSSSAAC